MKKVFFFSLLLTSTIVQAQTVLRVNNTPGSGAPYSTIAAAVTAAGPNDIIMVEGSNTSYGSITIAKKVTIIGPGYFLAENTGLQATLPSALFDLITLNASSDNSTITGVALGSLTISNCSNIAITNNQFNSFSNLSLTGTGSNVIVKSNYIRTFSCPGTFTGVIVSNNYIGGGQVVTDQGSFTFSNNLINPNGTTTLANAIVKNNIFIGWAVGFTGSILSNNVFAQGPVAGADATNIFNVNTSLLFVGLVGNTTDTQWRLRAGSPAIGAGEGGIDCGMYGGATPYRPSGIQAGQHTVYSLSVPATVIQNSTLNVKVSAKVN